MTTPILPNDLPLQRPESHRALFWAFTVLALQGFGGVVAVAQRELVERHRWLTHAQFVEHWAVAQMLPGPNVVNISLMVGAGFFGWTGAVAAAAGMLVFPLILLLIVASMMTQWMHHPAVMGALRGMSAVSAGLIAASSFKMLATLGKHPLGWRVSLFWGLVALILTLGLHWSLPVVLIGVGLPTCLWTAWILRKNQNQNQNQK